MKTTFDHPEERPSWKHFWISATSTPNAYFSFPDNIVPVNSSSYGSASINAILTYFKYW
jgi:hypothetical protein